MLFLLCAVVKAYGAHRASRIAHCASRCRIARLAAGGWRLAAGGWRLAAGAQRPSQGAPPRGRGSIAGALEAPLRPPFMGAGTGGVLRRSIMLK